MSSQLLLYLPVIHAGYERFLDLHANAEVLLLGESFTREHSVLKKEIRALHPERAASYLRALGRSPVRIVERDTLLAALRGPLVIAPDEEIIRELVDAFTLRELYEVRLEKTFLRWDREWSRASQPVGFDQVSTLSEASKVFAAQTLELGIASSDWWRQVGAVAAREAHLLRASYNRHQPSEYAPYFNGDPRNNFKRGVAIDLSTSLHAEADIVAWAAFGGVSLMGCDIYVSTFPCPGCARLIAAAGFKRCFFAGPYSMLDGEEVLRRAGVELIWVEVPSRPADES